uniref:Reverse transcriptase domain-containing protein n=1 Tax=Fagus sylvatica TaxID=28930 RepID=A0A2N9HTF4_FAGSY
MEKKSNETFREYAQRWREKAARARPPLDEREMIKIFVDTLKNPYFDRMIGLQMQFFVDLIPVARKDRRCLEDKEDSGHDGSNGISRTGRQESSDKEEGRRCANDREKQRKTKASPPELSPCNRYNLGLFRRQAPTQAPAPVPDTPGAGKADLTTAPQRRDFNPNSTCDFHFGEVGHTVENCSQLKHRVQDLIDHGVLKFEGLPNITTNPLPNHPEGGVNMVEIEEMGEERIAWRRLFYTLEKQRHITPLDAPPGPSTGDACEYHSGARGHGLECLRGIQEESHRSDGEWARFVTPEFEIFYENGDPEVHLQKYGEKMALHLENELLMISVFPESLSKQAAAWKDEEPYIIPDPGVSEVIVEIKEESDMSSLPALTEGEEEEKAKLLPPAKDPDSITIAEEGEEPIKMPPPSDIITTTTAEEEYAGPMAEGLSIHTITGRGGFHHHTTDPPLPTGRRSQDVDLRAIATACLKITRKTSNDPHVSKIDNKTNCSLDNIDNSDEEIELPSDILEALERQDEGSKPNIEELEIINLADEGEEPREVKIGTRCTTEQKEALIALLREFHEIFAWSYQDMPGLDTDIVVHKIPLKPECKPVKQALRRMKPEVILKIKEEVEKQLKAGFLSTVTYSDWVANIVPVPKKDGKVRMCVDYRDLNRASPKDNFPLPHIDTLVDNTATNAVFSFMDGFSGYNQIKMAEEDKSKTAFVTHWGTFVYDVMPFGLKNAGATYQRAMVTLFHDMIHHEIEVYVDDMIAKSRTAQDHLTDLRKLFQ